jgi:hypothetical protein
MNMPMHTAFKEQAKVKNTGLREKGLAQSHYSMKPIEEYYLLCQKDKEQDLYSSIIEIDDKEYCTGTVNMYLIRHRLEKKRLSAVQ